MSVPTNVGAFHRQQQEGTQKVQKNKWSSRYLLKSTAFCLDSLYVQLNRFLQKVGMVGDAQIGKTSLMVKYVEGTFDEDYIQTLGKISDGGALSTRPSSRI